MSQTSFIKEPKVPKVRKAERETTGPARNRRKVYKPYQVLVKYDFPWRQKNEWWLDNKFANREERDKYLKRCLRVSPHAEWKANDLPPKS